MICPACNQHTHRLISDKRGMACANCRGLSENGGANITGILTRNSDRVRAQQHEYEGDIILPHTFDKQLGRFVPNEDFMQRFPDKIATYFTKEELVAAGYSKPDKIFEQKAKQEAEVEAEKADVEYADDPDQTVMAGKIDALDE